MGHWEIFKVINMTRNYSRYLKMRQISPPEEIPVVRSQRRHSSAGA
jgi:hypothetical protein